MIELRFPKTSRDFRGLPETDVFVRFLSKTLFKTFQMIWCNLRTFGRVQKITVNFGQIWATLVKPELLDPLKVVKAIVFVCFS